MCGVAGLFNKTASLESSTAKLELMLAAIERRGPDAMGTWTDNTGLIFGHRRLSILDLSDAGKQPMSFEDRFHMTYNGEIYNFLELKKDLISKGFKFVSETDSEVLLKLFAHYGVDTALSKIKGMFAIALWDSTQETLTLIRDRSGEKPLYYGHVADDFVFASEIKAIKASSGEKLTLNTGSLASFFRHNYIAGPQTIYNEIFKLEPGSYLSLSLSDLKEKRVPEAKKYWALDPNQVSTYKGGFTSAKNDLSKLLDGVVSNQMISDVSLGSFLSGGVDSSLVTAVMQKLSNKPVKTFSIGFEESQLNEAPYAKDVAKHLGTDHTEFYVTSKDCLDWVEKIPEIYSEPFSDSSQIPTSIVSQMAREQVTVCLSGDGADEIFCGYSRYKMAHDAYAKIQSVPTYAKSIAAPIVSIAPEIMVNASYNFLRNFKKGLPEVKNPKQKITKALSFKGDESFIDFYRGLVSHSTKPETLVLDSKENTSEFNKNTFYSHPALKNYDKMMLLDFNSYLPGDILTKVDRASMYSSLETRVPFLDHELVELAWSLPLEYKMGEMGTKTILKSLVYDYIPQRIMDRPKSGFGIPIRTWVDVDLKPMITDLLSTDSVKRAGALEHKAVTKIVDDHYNGKVNNEYLIWDLLMFRLWQNKNS